MNEQMPFHADELPTFPEGVIAPFRDRDQLDFEVEFFGAILRRSPDYVDVLRCQARAWARKGFHHRGLEVETRLSELLPEDCVVAYDLACILSLMGRKQEAIQQLIQAVQKGYSDWLHLETDRDLDALRDEPAFQDFLRRYSP